MPRISVLMSVYNAETFLREAIDSVLSQTFTDFEFLIYEDCSTDGSLEIIQSYSDSRIKLVKNESNRGLTWNLYDGMNTASGDYVARMDADDICMPERFQKQVAFLDSNKDISIVGSAVVFFDDNGMEISGNQPLEHDAIKVELLLSFTMMHPSVMMRIADFRMHNLNYNPHFRYSQDFDLWTRAIQHLQFANHPDVLLRMREHSFKISTALKPQQKVFSDEIRQNQLTELGIDCNPSELAVFHSAASGKVLGASESVLIEGFLLKLLNKNNTVQVYNQRLLKRRTALMFYNICRQQLIDGDKRGFRFWRSKLISLEIFSPKQIAAMVFRSVKSLAK